MRIKVNKLFNGKVSIRDYEVNKAYKDQENIEIIFNNDLMIIPWLQLKSGQVSGEFQSKFGNKKYKLIDYDWEPDDNQLKLL